MTEAPETTEVPDPVRTRTRILDAAEGLFARHGFDGTSTARLARAAGVPKGLLFYYFPTKPGILTALLEERLGTSALDPAPFTVLGDPVQTLINVGERVLQDRAASGMLREIIWHESHTRAEVHTVLTRYRHALHDTVERALTASLPGTIDRQVLRAAASAWSAIITARPLEAPQSAGCDARRLHESDSLRAIAGLISAGVLASAS